MLPDKVGGSDGVAGVIDRIRATIRDPFDLGSERVMISASIGVAVFPEEGETREELTRRADADMYAQKQGAGATGTVNRSATDSRYP